MIVQTEDYFAEIGWVRYMKAVRRGAAWTTEHPREERKQMQGARTGSHSYSILQGKRKRCYLQTQKPGRWSGTIFISAQECGRYQINTDSGCGSSRNGTEERRVFMEGMGIKSICGLKQDCQRKFEETHTREEFMAIIGRNYLSDEAEQKKTQTPADTGGFYLLLGRCEHGQRNYI